MYDFYIPDALPQLNVKTYTISVEVNKYKTIFFLVYVILSLSLSLFKLLIKIGLDPTRIFGNSLIIALYLINHGKSSLTHPLSFQ